MVAPASAGVGKRFFTASRPHLFRSHGTFRALVTYTRLIACPSERESSMKEMLALSKITLLVPLIALLMGRADAQALENIKSQAELDKAISALDAAVFDSYNRC